METRSDTPASFLAMLNRGFRTAYLTYDELTAQVRGWAEAFPSLVRLTSIGTTDEGRELWLLTIGPEPDRVRPAVWVDANMHASELCGSSVALAIAEDMLKLHLGIIDGLPTASAPVPAQVPTPPAPALERLREVLFYVLPRMSPDGAELVLGTGQYVRSSPRDQRLHRNQPFWRCADIDGDGQIRRMRVRDPGGEWVEAPELPGVLVPRRIEDPGPYYKLYPEGVIEGFDGHAVPSPSFLSDNPTDLNRNFPWSWAPPSEQIGAGQHALSEPESRAVVEFATGHPHIFAWLNLHTFGGVLIRPLGNKPDAKMNPEDLALYRQIGAWCQELSGYPSVSGFEDFTYEPDKPLHGDLSDYAYHVRGCVSYVIELWDIFQQVGLNRPYKRFVERYTHCTREDMLRLAAWDREHNQGRVFQPWKPCQHPQLGEVEVGGIDTRVGISNPPYERLAQVCDQQSGLFLRVASLAPRLEVGNVSTTTLGNGLTRITISVHNTGYLPTYVLSSAKNLDFNEPLYATLIPEGVTLEDGSGAHRQLGHLDGWGRGLFDGSGAMYYPESRGNTGSRVLSCVVRGHGAVRVRFGSCRTGWIEQHVVVD